MGLNKLTRLTDTPTGNRHPLPATPRGAITHSIIHDDKKEVGDATRLLFAPGPVTVQFNFEKKFHDEIVAVVLLFLLFYCFCCCFCFRIVESQNKKEKHKFLIQTACSDRVIEPRKQHTAYSKGLHTRLAHQTGN